MACSNEQATPHDRIKVQAIILTNERHYSFSRCGVVVAGGVGFRGRVGRPEHLHAAPPYTQSRYGAERNGHRWKSPVVGDE